MRLTTQKSGFLCSAGNFRPFVERPVRQTSVDIGKPIEIREMASHQGLPRVAPVIRVGRQGRDGSSGEAQGLGSPEVQSRDMLLGGLISLRQHETRPYRYDGDTVRFEFMGGVSREAVQGRLSHPVGDVPRVFLSARGTDVGDQA